ncbi:MAG TPA: AgmX/PglI C-terminal domain-containing protein [Kofleriaceae bacterium]|nr:AgmX/PglI C-terminal domain-containing protein [Kofleriaceae bacterium]
MIGDSIIGVTHCVDPRRGRGTRWTRALAAVGLAALLAAAIAFGVSVRAAARDAAVREHDGRVLHRPVYSLRPHQAGALAEGIVLGGGLLGISALAVALLCARAPRERTRYRIGTAPGVDQPVTGAPSECFSLIAPSGDLLVLNYAPGIEGELHAGGVATPLSELVAAGRAHPSATEPGALEIVIPPAAAIRARVGGVDLWVSSVERPEPWTAPAPVSALDLRTMWCVAGSLALHLMFREVMSEIAHDKEMVITCGFWPIVDPGEPSDPEDCSPLTGCLREPDGSVVSREEAIERAHDVALSGGIIGRTWQREERSELAWAARDAAAIPDLEAAWRAPGDLTDLLTPRSPALMAPVSFPRSVSGGTSGATSGATLDRAAIKRRVKQHESQISYCYLREVLDRPSPGGWVTIQFLIGSGGDVQQASGWGFDEAVASCVARVIGDIGFPAPRGGIPATVVYPFQFWPIDPR